MAEGKKERKKHNENNLSIFLFYSCKVNFPEHSHN